MGKSRAEKMTTCTICGQQIPVDELQEHMRIELLDPRWKSQRDVLEARKAQASELQRGANVVSSLKNLARTRVDIFGAEEDEEQRKKEEEQEKLRRKEREKVVWDGHTASKANTLDKFSTNVNFDEQIAAIHRAKGLGPYVDLFHLRRLSHTDRSFLDKMPMLSVPVSDLLQSLRLLQLFPLLQLPFQLLPFRMERANLHTPLPQSLPVLSLLRCILRNLLL